MPWFWGKKSTNDQDHDDAASEDEESYDSEEYTDEDEEEEEEEDEEVEDDHSDHDDHDDDDKEGTDKDAENKETAEESAGQATAETVVTANKVVPAPVEASRDQHPSKVAAAAAAAASSLPTTSKPNGQESTAATADVSPTADSEDDEDEYHLALKPPSGLPSSHHSQSTDDENVSLIHSEGLHSGDESYLDTTDEEDDEEDDDDHDDDEEEEEEDEEDKMKDSAVKEDKANGVATQWENSKTTTVQVETVGPGEEDSDEGSDDENDKVDSHPDDEDDEEEEAPTSFWEKQSLLALAAEHDRVDILKGILADDDQNATNELMDSGVPPLHIAISFGSVNATQSLLRMGADPSIRPNIAEIKKEAQAAPEGSKLEIPNMGRFDGVTAWELAFGNAAYEEHSRNHRPSWSMFNGSSSSISLSSSARNDAAERIIKPMDMPPSKREGIRHAFTAEALRCIGADEVDRLKQLLTSGMPASIEVGGKDLYDWSVQLGGLQCEEYLRPIEFGKQDEDIAVTMTGESPLPQEIATTTTTPTKIPTTTIPDAPPSVGKVLDRPGDEMTVPLLINRLDELESLATALSTCLDNLAEEVSVCHGLLLLGGGASALAAHVRSLKTLQEQKRNLLFQAQQELDLAELELLDLVRSSGKVGEEVIALAPTMFLRPEYSRTESFRNHNHTDEESSQRQQQLLAQIAASENKILKLRASIADLSEENTKEMEQVERRGLTGGINLVRTLREELRDVDFQCSETKNRLATCRAQIGMIHSRLPKQELKASSALPTDAVTTTAPNHAVIDDGIVLVDSNNDNATISKVPSSIEIDTNTTMLKGSEQPTTSSKRTGVDPRTTTTTSAASPIKLEPSKLTLDRPIQAIPGRAEVKRKDNTPRGTTATPATTTHMTDSEKIANGDSQALAIRPSGNRGFFTVDLWQVILRIIGLEEAANRRGARIAQKQKGTPANLMIV